MRVDTPPIVRALALGTLAIALVLLGSVSVPARQAASTGAPPRLVVFLVMDQFTVDYVELYSRMWTRGLRRLLDEGAFFSQAAYPYGGTVTCAGHSTIGTGAFPQRHGMVANSWYDRDLDKAVTCEEDPSVKPVLLSDGNTVNRHSAAYMKVPAFADELRRQSKRLPNIVSMAEKPRSAIGMGGHGGPGTAVLWESTGGVWSTSTAYTSTPWPDVQEFMRRNPLSNAYGEIWTKLLPEASYQFADDGAGEQKPAPWGKTFPHTIHSPHGIDDPQFLIAWQRSPLSDAFLVDLAIHMIKSRKLGSQPGTDMLAVSLGALDQSGHQFGPRSHEVQDILARADVAIGRLLEALDREVGVGRYVVAFSADHGVARMPEEVTANGGSAGRIASISGLATGLLQWSLGAGKHVGLAEGSQVALTRSALKLLQEQPATEQLLFSALSASPGVSKVFRRQDLASTEPTTDRELAAWRLSFVPDRTGDYVVITKPGWIYGATDTNHGSASPYDQRVPVVLFGAGIKKGTYTASASPADIAPTFASLAGIDLPMAQGRVLNEALAR